MSDSASERGRRLMKDVCGIDVPSGMGRFSDLTIDHLFGAVWSNENLSIRDRRLVVLGALGALGDAGNLEVHMTQALQRGDLTAEELDEVVIQITHYAGWPRGTAALAAAGKAKATKASGNGG
jgi:4-carboxymuconolactone decarboxylase